MSQDRNLEDRAGGPTYARCKKQPSGKYTSLYAGTQREPKHADERGAAAVIECLFGGRVRLYNDGEGWMRVEYDPAWRSE